MFETTNTHGTPGNRKSDIAAVIFKINYAVCRLLEGCFFVGYGCTIVLGKNYSPLIYTTSKLNFSGISVFRKRK